MIALYLIWYILFFVAIIPNIFLFYLNMRKKNQFGQPITLLMIDVIISDIVIAIGSWLAMACGVPSSSMQSYNPSALGNTTQMTIYFGHCDILGADVCYHSQRLAQHAVLNNIYVVLASFLVRKRILQNGNFKYQHAVVVGFLAYLPALLTLVLQYTLQRETGHLLSSDPLLSNIALSPDQNIPYSTVYPLSIRGSVLVFFSSGPVFGGTIAALLLRRHLRKVIISHSPRTMSPATRKLNLAFIQSLTLQACIPLLSFLSSLAFIGVQFLPLADLRFSPIINSFNFIVNIWIPCLNSCTALFIIPSHRRYVVNLITRQNMSSVVISIAPAPSISGRKSGLSVR